MRIIHTLLLRRHNNMKKKFLFISILIALISLTLGIAYANCAITEGNLTYITVSSPEHAYVQTCDKSATNVVIASEVDGYPVTAIECNAFANCSNLTSVTIPNTINFIGWHAFENCCKLQSITLPSSITELGWGVFSGCNSLKSISIPTQITSIGEYMFSGCSSLTNVTIPNNITSIGMGAFWDCTNLKSISIPTSIINIGDLAFLNCNSLKGISVKAGTTLAKLLIKASWNKCFSPSYPDLLWCETDDGLTITGFSNSGLTKVSIPDQIDGVKVVAIEGSTFWGCENLKSVSTQAGTVVSKALYKSGWNKCVSSSCPDLLWYETDDGLFINGSINTNVSSVVIPDQIDGVKVIGIASYAFYDNTKITNVTIPSSIMSIGSEAFANCSSLTNITIPNNISSIEWGVFRNCKSLKSISIKAGTDTAKALKDSGCDCVSPSCPDLLWYETDEGLTIQGLTNPSMTHVTVPDKIDGIKIIKINTLNGAFVCTYTGAYAAGWKDQALLLDNLPSGTFGNLKWNINKDLILTISGSGKMTSNSSEAPWRKYSKGIEKIVIEQGATTIGNNAFSDFSHLRNIVVPDSITDIGSSAFNYCTALTNVTIPDSVTNIGWGAFNRCSNLTSVKLPKNLTCIVSSLFNGCTHLSNVKLPNKITSINDCAFSECSGLTDISIPEGVSFVGSSAFNGCTGLKTVEIPTTVTSIESYAFYGCSGLETITIPSSVENIGSSAIPGTATILCNKGSYAATWAKENGYAFQYLENIPITAIILNKTEKTLTITTKKKNPTYQLSVKGVEPEGATVPKVKWSSDNKKVATVDKNGLVKAIKPGEATITAKATDGSGIKAICKITVENQKVKSFTVVQKGKSKTLKGKTVTLKKGKTLKLQIKSLKPSTAINKNITYKSSDKKIATVSKLGVIKAIKKGTVTITVQSKDKGYKVTFKVKVK